MKKLFLALFFVLFASNVFAQNSYQSHIVEKGETVYSISKKYNTSEETIYQLNPDVRHVIKTGMVLILPIDGEEVTISTKKHRVKRRESLKSIALKYNITEDLLKKYNKYLYARDVKKGERIHIPVFKSTNTITEGVSAVNDTITTYTVLPKETKYGIARKYGITIAELELLNLMMGESLNIGEEIKVPKKIISTDTTIIEDDEFEYYEVLPKEGFFRLKVKFGLTQEEIIALNPYAFEGLKEGMILKIPKSTNVIDGEKFDAINLEDYIVNTSTKKLAVMLPFLLNRINLDSLSVNTDLLKTDGTLRAAIDFYSGVLMAAEFAKDKGISTEINIYDTDGKASKVEQIIHSNDFSTIDALIGPLLSKNIEKAAASLQSQNIPVFSPLSKVKLKEYPNLYQTIPSNEMMGNAMLEYIKKRVDSINVILITGKEWTKQKGVIMAAIPTVKTIVPETGNYLYLEDIQKQLDKFKENWVILESDNPILVSNVVGLLNGFPEVILNEDDVEVGRNNIRLFAVNKSRAFDYDDVSNMHLANLNFTYPSASKHYDYELMIPFLVSYKNKYGVMPNNYAIRGFDVTYDVLLRLANAETLKEASTSDIKTEYVENKFQYSYKRNSGYKNQAFYIMKYNNELELEVVE
ncbi:MAG: LysM repeat protein [bacterium]|jgi:LysM repeat protein